MKCIKMHGVEVITKRVSDMEAMKLVDAGKASYMGKEEYKKINGKGPATTPRTSGRVKKAKKSDNFSL